ncbi:MAG: PDZ domain-containing protein [Armatimonadetes bacterium]|nr:PDZ domain-containing protein [Armatimonadota bacterium]MBS1700537.1 PDZ domain-containing protein [Armatimonadota bacterium]MBS1728978.1 PDZ domain-containing protein [Armatimonadota bacterium]
MKKSLLVGLSLALAALGYAQTIDGKPEVRDEILQRLSSTIENAAFIPGTDFKKWEEFLKTERPKIDAAKNDDEFKAAVNEALQKFGFSHIVLATPRDANIRNTGQTVGIGVSSQPSPDGNGRIIIRVVEKSPASDAGLEPGDTMLEIDGKKITPTTVLTGENGSKVKLKIRKADGKLFEYTITRRPFSTVRKDEFRMLNDSTGYLKVNTFDQAYDPKAIDGFMDQAMKAKNLVVDLRFNGGGSVFNLLHLAGYFVDPKLKLGFMLDRNSVTQFKKEEKRDPKELAELTPFANTMIMTPRKEDNLYKGNLIILINAGTGSASEIFTAAMRDLYGKKTVDKDGKVVVDMSNLSCTVIGSKSAGAVLFSTFTSATNGFALQIPVADYLTPSSERLEGHPIDPDVTAEDPKILLPTAPDKAIEAALAIAERIHLRDTRVIGK